MIEAAKEHVWHFKDDKTIIHSIDKHIEAH